MKVIYIGLLIGFGIFTTIFVVNTIYELIKLKKIKELKKSSVESNEQQLNNIKKED